MKSTDLKEIITEFNLDSESCPYGEGHINDTYYIEFMPHEYILQKINHKIFHNIEKLMENIQMVTDHLRKKIVLRGGNPDRETLTVLTTKSGLPYLKTDDGYYFRLYKFVNNTDTYQNVENKNQFYNAAKAFGRFQNDLADFPSDSLFETIADFHNTGKRFENLVKAMEEDKCGRKKDIQTEIAFALARKKDTDIIVDALKGGSIPLRVTHNDTKLNNVLFEKDSDTAICVIDLDTVMPGSMLYDFGDSIRFGASSALEDERDLSKVYCDLELFEAFTEGFLEEISSSINEKERELLAFSAKLMTYECGIRFLTDYLEGDTYFKIHRPEHNLDRARNQFKLVADMEEKMDKMNSIVRGIK